MPRLTARICGLGTAALFLLGDLAAQQPSGPVCPGRWVHLQILGSGGPGASAGRASASYLVWIDGASRVMVDAGGGTKDQFHESGADLANVLFMGPPGVGKNHLAVALGVKAIKNGFSTTHFLLDDLMHVFKGDAATPPRRLKAKRYLNNVPCYLTCPQERYHILC